MPIVFYTKGTAGAGNGVELWASDGTPAGTRLVSDINPGTGSSDPFAMGIINGKMVFSASDNGTTRGVFTSDGTSVTKISPEGLTSAAVLLAFNGVGYFFGNEATAGRELWSTDGTTVTMLTNAAHSPSGLPFGFGNSIIYAANTEGAYNEVYSYNTVDHSAGLFKEIFAGKFGSEPMNFTKLGDKFIFEAKHAQYGNELWISDGTPEGTDLLIDLNVNMQNRFDGTSSLAGLFGIAVIDGDRAVFSAVGSVGSTSTGVWGIYVTDGTGPGTIRLTSPTEVIGGTQFDSSGGKAFFLSANKATGTELWVSDGTIAGTHPVKDLNPSNQTSGTDDSTIGYSGVGIDVNGTLFFWGNDGTHGMELYKTDGTEEGTVLVKDISEGALGSLDKGHTTLKVYDNRLYFIADDGSGLAVWRSNGTEAGTVKIAGGGEIGTIVGYLPGSGAPATPMIIGTNKADTIDDKHAPKNQPKATNKAEIIDGKAGDDTIKAQGGDDTITGGKGKDVIDGGKGKDAFVFDTKLAASNVDTLVKFKVKDDTIWLDKDVFTKLGAVGDTIGDKAFFADKSGKAHDKNDRLVYETDTGKLRYDDNGNKSGHAVLIAVLDKGLHLTEADFLVV